MPIRNTKGQGSVAVLIHQLETLAEGCDKALASGGDPEMASVGSRAKVTLGRLVDADGRKKAAHTEVINATAALDQTYFEARLIRRQLRAFVHSRLGYEDARLVDFGIRPVHPRVTPRKKAAPVGPEDGGAPA